MYDVNFFEGYLPKPKKTNYTALIMLLIGVLLIGAIGFLEFTHYENRNSLKEEIKRYEAENNDPEVHEQLAQYEAKKQVQMEMSSTLSKLEIIDVFMLIKKVVYSGLLTEVSKSVPDNCYINDISIEDNTVNISGYADGYESVAQFQHQLRDVDRLKLVFTPTISEDNSNYAFSIAALIELGVIYED